MDHREISEIVAGRIVFGLEGPDVVNPSLLSPPYDSVVFDFQAGADPTSLYGKYGFSVMSPLENAMKSSQELHNINWLRMLEERATNADLGRRLGKVSQQLEKGEEIDVGKVLGLIQNMQDQRMDFVTLNKVEPETDIWQPTHYTPIDSMIGGFPKGGLVTIGGPPGTGKTTLALRLMIDMAKAGKEIGFFSLEMTLGQIVLRAIEVDKTLTDEEKSRIYASDEVCGVYDVYAKATQLKAKHPKISLIVIDFADLMVEKEQSEQVMGQIYIRLSVLAKRLGCPVVLLSQLSRAYVGGEPMINHLRYSGMAEAMSSLILLLYNPEGIWVDQGQNKKQVRLPWVPGYAYLIVGKSRYGYKRGSVGAIRIKWNGGPGWSRDSFTWHPLMGG